MLLLKTLLNQLQVLPLQNLLLLQDQQLNHSRLLSLLQQMIFSHNSIKTIRSGVTILQLKEKKFTQLSQKKILILLLLTIHRQKIHHLTTRYRRQNHSVVHLTVSLTEKVHLRQLLPLLNDQPELQKVTEQLFLVLDSFQSHLRVPNHNLLHEIFYLLIVYVKSKQLLDSLLAKLRTRQNVGLNTLVANLLQN